MSEQCWQASARNKGIFTLTVPTGGGKTLASLRFALSHAERHNLDRIIYIIPFTTIIDQNAEVIREILETVPEEKGEMVLEHHSNIGAEKQTWKEKILSENWDAPVVLTTMVQFFEAFFGGGTRGARRMHQLARSVIIFDEIQTLPVKCVHMFCNAVNFLVNQCGSSVVLCTATQPLLGDVDASKGALALSSENEMVKDVKRLFSDLKRVNVVDWRKPQGRTDDEIAELAHEEVRKTGSCLVVVNTKLSARNVFTAIESKTHGTDVKCFHLSTAMCPAHRKEQLKDIVDRIKPENNLPTLCVSTQLIEAGVDVDFGSAIRFVAGLDSIAQTAGRCNRNKRRDIGNVYIVNPSEEKIERLKDISIGKEKTERVLNDFQDDPTTYRDDPIGPELLKWYYQNYFFDRKTDMDYAVTVKEAGRTDTLLNLLSTNQLTVHAYKNAFREFPQIDLRQSFMTAGQIFRSIDAPTQSVIVQYGDEGKNLVAELCGAFDLEKQFELLRKAQQFSVNLFPNEFQKLSERGALCPIQKDTDLFFLDSKYYDDRFGISMEVNNTKEDLLYV
ncbi:MAG: CRISPR-associated helicase Cas3' [Chitinivibrionales bacterium]|nr:CRISPR-associated helicase Cas3' [Chitinivibrionales bacterium]